MAVGAWVKRWVEAVCFAVPELGRVIKKSNPSEAFLQLRYSWRY